MLRRSGFLRIPILALAGVLCGASIACIGCASPGGSAALTKLAVQLQDARTDTTRPDLTSIHWMGVGCIALAILSALVSAAVPSMARPRLSIMALLCGIGAIYLAFVLAQPWVQWALFALCAVALVLGVAHFVSVHRQWWSSRPSSPEPAMPAASGAAA